MSNTAESDGVRWCVCLLVAHAVEAGTIAIGRQERVLNIAQPRLDHRELGHVVCLLIGLMHGIRPIPRRLKLWTAIVFELIFLAWLAPCMPALTHPVVERTRGMDQAERMALGSKTQSSRCTRRACLRVPSMRTGSSLSAAAPSFSHWDTWHHG